MITYTLQRCAWMLMSLAGVLLLSFFLIHLVPGDPVEMMLGETASALDKAHLRTELGLDLTLPKQLGRYLINLSHFDLGLTLNTRESVASEIATHFPATFELALAALFCALLWGLPLGVMSAVRSNTGFDHVGHLVTLLGMSIPGVFLGPTLIYLFAIRLDWFPISDRGGIEHLVLPALSLALPLGAVIAKMTRASVLEVLNNDYMRTARAKGLGDFKLYFKHALGNAMIPIVTIVGLQLSALLTGTVITETIFDWPGLGLLLFGALQRRDYPLVQGAVLFVACVYVIVNWLTDLMYGLLNPRVRLARPE